ncbi:MAG: ADP-ribosylglycohydrolase family protein [Alphaproteobacteria bacterium]|nr:ADP-ribosylglycohydrolase family protein [Alphaproteobacteria bacterium]
MIGAIAGDIVGSRFENYRSPPSIFDLFDSQCRFTDDTVCNIAIADALMGGKDIAQTLRMYVRRHPKRGYGGMFFKWASSDDAPAYGSWGNGAPMRTISVGWLAKSESEAAELATAQASVSHDHDDAVAASQAVSLTIYTLRHGGTVDDIRRLLANAFNYDLRPDVALTGGRFDITAKGTVVSAMAAALESQNWESAVRRVIALGGDTDTLACIAGAVAEAMHGVPATTAERAKSYLTPDLRAVLDRFDEQMR